MRIERGFTLAEVMISLSILALIGTLTYGVFNRTLAARQQAAAITEHYHMVRQAMQRMSREISMAFITPYRDCEDPRTDTLFVGDRSGRSHRLDFTSFGHFKTRADANESDQNEISYYVDQDPDDNKTKALIRRSSPRIDDEPDEGGIEQVLARNVEGFELEFYDDDDDRWVDEWDSKNLEQRNRLPLFVKLTLNVETPSGDEEVFTTKTRIALTGEITFFGTSFARCPE